MAKGTVVEINQNSKSGYIQPEKGGQKIYFRLNWVRNLPQGKNVEEGMSVDFESKQANNRLETVWVRYSSLLESSHSLKTTRKETAVKPSSRGSHFLNPYNFVRYLAVRPNHPNDPIEVQSLGECPPPPHDRWLGLSGCIDCRATVVTPLFIADAEDISPDEDEEKHKHYHFFNINGKMQVPASSIRGMFRSLFEAATNSRFGVFQQDEFPMEYRQARVPVGFMPVRVIGIDKNGVAALEKLDCRKPSDTEKVMNSAWVPAYKPSVKYKMNRRDRDMIPGDDKLTSQISSLPSVQQRVAALVSISPKQHQSGRFSYYEVKEGSIVLAQDHVKLVEGNGWEKAFGYLHITGPNIERKHHERFFFRRGDVSLNDHTYEALNKNDIAVVSPQVVKEYNQRLAEYYDRNQRNAPKKRIQDNWPLTSEFVKRGRRLEKGDLVYLIEDQQTKRQFLRPVSIPRLPYIYPRQRFLPVQYHPASNEQQLSPADRLFGWVQGSGNEGAYAGRLHFSSGEFIESKLLVIESEIPLAILSTPKPTTTRFYLSHNSWKAKERPDDEAGYDNLENRLRGRKFYRHYMPSQFDEANYQVSNNEKGDQNRTVHSVVNKDSEFTFSIQFENLNSVELGALLWTVEMEDGMHHRLGMAKPLGFGSLRIRIEEGNKKGLRLLNVVDRYQSINKDGWTNPLSENERADLILCFKKAMVFRYLPEHAQKLKSGNASDIEWANVFATLDNIADLMALLKETPANIPIHYPRLPGKTGENFEWFMRNKKPSRWNNQIHKNIRGEWTELEVPTEEARGQGLKLDVTGEKPV